MASIKKSIVFCYVLYYKIASLELNGSICSNIDTDIFYDNVISAKEYQKTPRGNNMSHFLWEIEKKIFLFNNNLSKDEIFSDFLKFSDIKNTSFNNFLNKNLINIKRF